MKIVFVYDAVYPWVKGGVEKRIRELADRLAARGHDVHIIGMKYWEGPDTLAAGGVTLHGICPARPLYAGGRRKLKEAIYFSAWLVPFLVREDFDIIDCQQFPFFPCFPVSVISALKKKSCVITWHEVWGDYWYTYLGLAGVFGKAIEGLVARLPFPRIAVSGTTAAKLRSIGIHEDAIIVPNGINIFRLRSTPVATISSDIIFVGRLIREKHVDVLIRAFACLVGNFPGIRLLILGDGPERESLEALIQELNIGSRVRMIPSVESHDLVIGLMKASHVCVIPSTREGFGIAALEALACGLPVVTIDHPDNAIRDLITKETGFLASLSPDDLAGKIGEALRRAPCEECVSHAIAETYDWDRIALQLESIYRSIVSQ